MKVSSQQPPVLRLIASIPRAFRSEAVYHEAFGTWKGTGLLYLVLLLAFASVIMTAGMIQTLRQEIRGELPYFLDSVPVVRISGGKLSLEDKPPPVVLSLQGRELIVIDPRGVPQPSGDGAIPILVSEHEVRIRWFPGRDIVFSLADVEDMRIDRAKVQEFMEESLALFPVLLFPLGYVTVLLTSCVWWIVQALFYAVISSMLLFKAGNQPPLSACLRVTSVALTPAIVVRSLFALFAVTSAWAELFIVVVEVAYVFLAFRSVLRRRGPQRDTTENL